MIIHEDSRKSFNDGSLSDMRIFDNYVSNHSFEIDAFLKLLLLMLLIYRNHYLMFYNNMKRKENFSDGKRL